MKERRERAQRERWTRANDSKTMQLFAITASVRGSRNYPILFPLLVPPALGSLPPLHPTTELSFLSLYTRSTLPGVRICIRAVYIHVRLYTYI